MIDVALTQQNIRSSISFTDYLVPRLSDWQKKSVFRHFCTTMANHMNVSLAKCQRWGISSGTNCCSLHQSEELRVLQLWDAVICKSARVIFMSVHIKNREFIHVISAHWLQFTFRIYTVQETFHRKSHLPTHQWMLRQPTVYWSWWNSARLKLNGDLIRLFGPVGDGEEGLRAVWMTEWIICEVRRWDKMKSVNNWWHDVEWTFSEIDNSHHHNSL